MLVQYGSTGALYCLHFFVGIHYTFLSVDYINLGVISVYKFIIIKYIHYILRQLLITPRQVIVRMAYVPQQTRINTILTVVKSVKIAYAPIRTPFLH